MSESNSQGDHHSDHEAIFARTDAAEHDRFWPILLLLAAFLAMSYGLYAPNLPAGNSDLPLDKLGHFAMFAVVAALAVLVEIRIRWIVVILIVQAVLSEIIQHLVLPGRAGDPWDLLADLLGIAIGVLAGLWLSPAVRRRMVRK